ncbi:kidney androgen-regulated protein-like isoform X2 [Mesocricetus auratus]|uniref:Kidney androgen-regulated protein isoform X2 n=1 Tax=Mesocricetus auratus TaxID=10036 RepID=A0ABM2X9Z3_MESAU|nr:kidney androgen-regulated protein isoform X2 [Mesocricetus auratus]XP_040599649.1 kidney androgen-regulated protein-like isoform X2 [Mesocricetus auratus]
MMLSKILVICILCALGMAFSRVDRDPYCEEVMNSSVETKELLEKLIAFLKSQMIAPPPIERVVEPVLPDDTDNHSVTDFNCPKDCTSDPEVCDKSIQISVSSPEAEIVPNSFLEEATEIPGSIPSFPGNDFTEQ